MHSKQFLITASSLLIVPLLVSAIPQSSTSSSTCAAIQVLNACVSSTTAITQSCSTTDYGCLCQKWGDVLTCYNQCPNDPGVGSVQSQKALYCNDALAYPSSTTSAVATATNTLAVQPATAVVTSVAANGSATATVKLSGSSTATGTASGSKTTSGSSSSASASSSTSSKSDGGRSMRAGVSGLALALVAGAAGLFL